MKKINRYFFLFFILFEISCAYTSSYRPFEISIYNTKANTDIGHNNYIDDTFFLYRHRMYLITKIQRQIFDSKDLNKSIAIQNVYYVHKIRNKNAYLFDSAKGVYGKVLNYDSLYNNYLHYYNSPITKKDIDSILYKANQSKRVYYYKNSNVITEKYIFMDTAKIKLDSLNITYSANRKPINKFYPKTKSREKLVLNSVMYMSHLNDERKLLQAKIGYSILPIIAQKKEFLPLINQAKVSKEN